MYSKDFKKEAIKLRQKGISIIQIAKKLGISKSTSSLWVHNIKLPKKYRNRLNKNSISGREKGLEMLRIKRELQNIEIKNEAEKIIKSIKPDTDFWKFCAALLFWCEGSKQTSYLKFTNSDPNLIKLFLHSLIMGFNINKKHLRALVHLHNYHDEKLELNFWSKITGIPTTQFHKSYKKPNNGIRKRENYHGCIAIGYSGEHLAKKLSALYHCFAKKF